MSHDGECVMNGQVPNRIGKPEAAQPSSEAEGLPRDCPAYVRTLEHDIDALSGWALRYALGRMTYAVADVAGTVTRNLDVLSRQTLTVMASDIEEADERGALGMEMDAEQWRVLRHQIAEVLTPARVTAPEETP